MPASTQFPLAKLMTPFTISAGRHINPTASSATRRPSRDITDDLGQTFGLDFTKLRMTSRKEIKKIAKNAITLYQNTTPANPYTVVVCGCF